VTGEGSGVSIEQPFAVTLPDSADLIRWTIGDYGFAMHLSGEVPGRIRGALRTPDMAAVLARRDGASVSTWAVHAGGRSILDAVGDGLGLGPDALDDSRAVLQDYGNMSSSTLMFVLARQLERAALTGVAMAFGPGLAAEGFHLSAVTNHA